LTKEANKTQLEMRCASLQHKVAVYL